MKKDLRVIKTKESLHTALLALLEEKPLEKITIAELCRQAKVNRGTFYLHYQDVEELFAHYFKEITQDLKTAYYEPYHLTNFRIQQIEPHMVRIFHHVQKFKPFYAIVFNHKAPIMYYYNLFEIIRDYMKESIQVNPHLNDDVLNYNASYQANAILGILIEWNSRGFRETPEELNKLLIQFSKSFT